MSGMVYFNGKPRTQAFYENSAYVRQDDVHIPTLTVRHRVTATTRRATQAVLKVEHACPIPLAVIQVDETLRFAARLRVGNEYSDEEREQRINTVAEILGLNVCRYSFVGDAALRGISGGQVGLNAERYTFREGGEAS